METQAQSPPTPALHTRQGEGGTRRREGGLWGERMGSPGAYPEGVRWSPARLRWRGPRPSASGTEERGASPLTPDSRRACHTCTPLGQRPGHTRGHTQNLGPPPSLPYTHTPCWERHTHPCCRDPGICGTGHMCTHTHTVPSCMLVHTHTHTHSENLLSLPPQKLESNFLSGSRSQECPLFGCPTPGALGTCRRFQELFPGVAEGL